MGRGVKCLGSVKFVFGPGVGNKFRVQIEGVSVNLQRSEPSGGNLKERRAWLQHNFSQNSVTDASRRMDDEDGR